MTRKSSFLKALFEEPDTSNYCIAYLDILGAKEYMKNDDEKFLCNLNSIYEDAIKDVAFTNEVTAKDINIKIFSDNILLAVKIFKNDTNRVKKIEKILNLAGNIYNNALKHGYLIRGGITEGMFFKNEIFVYGKALVDAVDIEERYAIYPRIIAQEEIVKILPQYFEENTDSLKQLNCFLFSTTFEHLHYKIALTNLIKEYHQNYKIRQKIMWVVSYFNRYFTNPISGALEKPQITNEDIENAINSEVVHG